MSLFLNSVPDASSGLLLDDELESYNLVSDVSEYDDLFSSIDSKNIFLSSLSKSNTDSPSLKVSKEDQLIVGNNSDTNSSVSDLSLDDLSVPDNIDNSGGFLDNYVNYNTAKVDGDSQILHSISRSSFSPSSSDSSFSSLLNETSNSENSPSKTCTEPGRDSSNSPPNESFCSSYPVVIRTSSASIPRGIRAQSKFVTHSSNVERTAGITKIHKRNLADEELMRLISAPIPKSGILVLTEQERNTYLAEKYPIPKRLPLTPVEERQLKAVRRRIKNKISAKQSRQKKALYTETLEQRVSQYKLENSELKDKLRNLEIQNKSLASQLRRLQSPNSVNITSSESSTKSTILMVMVLAFAVFTGSAIHHHNPDSNDPSGSSIVSLFSSFYGNTNGHQNSIFSLIPYFTSISNFDDNSNNNIDDGVNCDSTSKGVIIDDDGSVRSHDDSSGRQPLFSSQQQSSVNNELSRENSHKLQKTGMEISSYSTPNIRSRTLLSVDNDHVHPEVYGPKSLMCQPGECCHDDNLSDDGDIFHTKIDSSLMRNAIDSDNNEYKEFSIINDSLLIEPYYEGAWNSTYYTGSSSAYI